MFVTNSFFFHKTLRLAAGGGAYHLTAKPMDIRRLNALAAQRRTYALSSQSAGLRRASKVGMTKGSVAAAGKPVQLRRSLKLAVVGASISVGGKTVGLQKSRVAGFVLGTYSITGQSTQLRRGMKLQGSAATLSLTTNSVGLLKVAGRVDALPFEMVVDAKSALLRATRLMGVTAASVVATGRPARLLRGFPYQVNPASYSALCKPAVLRVDRRLLMVKAGWAFAQQSVDLVYAPNLVAVSFLGSAANTGAATTHTFAGQPLGTAVDRYLVLATSNSGGTVVSGVTADGVSGSPVYNGGQPVGPSFWKVPLTEANGPTGTIAITLASSATHLRLGWWVVYGPWNGIPSAMAINGTSAATNPSVALTIAKDATALASARNVGPSAFTWSNATEKWDSGASVSSNNLQLSGAEYLNTTGASINRTIAANANASRLAAIVIP